jgi:DNA repair exonuclease SbcCD nuclease subunit
MEERNPDLIKKKFEKLSGRYDFVFGHLSIEGVKTGPSNFMLAGTVTKDLINKNFEADKIILGHIHKPQKSGDIYYCGSPDYLNFGERNEKKRFLYYSGKELESIELNLLPLCQIEVTPTETIGEFKDKGIYKLVVSCDKKEAGAINLDSISEKIKLIGGKLIKINWNISTSERRKIKGINFKKNLAGNVKEYIKKFAAENIMQEIWDETGIIWKLAKQS